MKTYHPPHRWIDADKVSRLVATMLEHGMQAIPPIVVCGEIALTGSHRIAAYDKVLALGAELDEMQTVEIEDEDLRDALKVLDCEYLHEAELNDVVEQLHATAEGDLQAALSDQF
mgnify:CR=1 FL=1